MRFLIMLSLFLLPLSAFAQATPAWALEPSRYESINQTWTGSPMPNGGTSYSNGLDFVEVSPSGPYSSTYSAWSRDGKQTTGTIYMEPRYEYRPQTGAELLERAQPYRSAPRSCDPSCAYPTR